jgi:hypothetical protein
MKYSCYRLSQGRAALSQYKGARSSGGAIAPELRNADGDLVEEEAEDLLRLASRAASPRAAKALSGDGWSPDQVEGLLGLELFGLLSEFPSQALSDPDFWRYVAVETLREFVYWRDGANCSQASFGLSSARRIPDCVPLRMFNRALLATRIEDAGGPEAKVTCTAGGADMWQSHVLRVQNRFDSRIVQDLVLADQSGEIPNVAVMREVAKDVRQVRANVVLELQPDRILSATIKGILDAQEVAR